MKYHLPEGVLRAEVEGDEVLLNPATGVYHLLNPSGREVLERLDQGLTPDEAARALASDRDVEFDSVLTDCQAFIRAMVDRGLLEERS